MGNPSGSYLSRIARRFLPLIERPQGNAASQVPGTLFFQCNVCGAGSATLLSALEREAGHCRSCGSIMRFRAVVHHLSVELFGVSLNIEDFPPTARRFEGIGMSDSAKYAMRLEKKLRYTNTFYHQAPVFDVQSAHNASAGSLDFVISSDVFEHVAPPIGTAFGNLRRVLRKGGALIFTVPFGVEGDTIEHFPELHDYRIEKRDGRFVLCNRTKAGVEQKFENVIFHGGPGNTLEMRLFSESGVRRELTHAGFTDIKLHREPVFERGIYWNAPWSVPITARAA